MNELSDQRVHLWARVLAPVIEKSGAHGTCGVHIGRFTRHFSDVTCPECLEIISLRNGGGA